MHVWFINGDPLPPAGYRETRGSTSTESAHDPAIGGLTSEGRSCSGSTQVVMFNSISDAVDFTYSSSAHRTSSESTSGSGTYEGGSVTIMMENSGTTESSSEAAGTLSRNGLLLLAADSVQNSYSFCDSSTSSSSMSWSSCFSGTTMVGTRVPTTSTESSSGSDSASGGFSSTDQGSSSSTAPAVYGGTTETATAAWPYTSTGVGTLQGSYIGSTTTTMSTYSNLVSGTSSAPTTTTRSRTYTSPVTASFASGSSGTDPIPFSTIGTAMVTTVNSQTGELLDPGSMIARVISSEDCIALYTGGPLGEGDVSCACDYLEKIDATTLAPSATTSSSSSGSSTTAGASTPTSTSGVTQSTQFESYHSGFSEITDEDYPQLMDSGTWYVLSPVQFWGYQPASACLGSDSVYKTYSIAVVSSKDSPYAVSDRQRGRTYNRNGVTQVLPYETFDTLVMLNSTTSSGTSGEASSSESSSSQTTLSGGLGGYVVPSGNHTLFLSSGCYHLTWLEGSMSSTDSSTASSTVTSMFAQGLEVTAQIVDAYQGGFSGWEIGPKVFFAEKPCSST